MLTDHLPPVRDRSRIPDVIPVEDEAPFEEVTVDERSVLGLTELLLKAPNRLNQLTRDGARQPLLIPSFLGIGLASFSLFALALVLTFTAAPIAALPGPFADSWPDHPVGSAVALWAAYSLGFTLATGVCLPSFYFYGLLAGVRVTALQVTSQIMKGQASTAMMLMGILPVYLAMALGTVIFGAPPEVLRNVLWVGLGLPFIAGLWGVRSIYRGFLGLSDTLPPERRFDRECWLRRLTFSCSGCYTAVCPVMIYTLWRFFADHLAGV
jgi:hypothetical protein